MEDEGRDWFVGVDWALQTHHVFVIDAKGRKLGERGFTHGGEGLAEMAAWIVKQTGTAPSLFPNADGRQILGIQTVRYTQESEGGTLTTLECVLPNALSPCYADPAVKKDRDGNFTDGAGLGKASQTRPTRALPRPHRRRTWTPGSNSRHRPSARWTGASPRVWRWNVRGSRPLASCASWTPSRRRRRPTIGICGGRG